MKNPALVRHRRGQALIAIMDSMKKIKLLTSDPFLDLNSWKTGPRERSCSISLPLTVHFDRVVSARPAEKIALAIVVDIFQRPRIQQQIVPLSNQPNTE